MSTRTKTQEIRFDETNAMRDDNKCEREKNQYRFIL